MGADIRDLSPQLLCSPHSQGTTKQEGLGEKQYGRLAGTSFTPLLTCFYLCPCLVTLPGVDPLFRRTIVPCTLP